MLLPILNSPTFCYTNNVSLYKVKKGKIRTLDLNWELDLVENTHCDNRDEPQLPKSWRKIPSGKNIYSNLIYTNCNNFSQIFNFHQNFKVREYFYKILWRRWKIRGNSEVIVEIFWEIQKQFSKGFDKILRKFQRIQKFLSTR